MNQRQLTGRAISRQKVIERKKTLQGQQDPGYVSYLPYVAAIFLVIACLLYVSGRKGIRRTKLSEESSEDPYS